MKIPLARFVSILGHPLLLLPAAAVGVAVLRHATEDVIHLLVSMLVSVIVAVLAFSIWSVWSGRWKHIDADQPSERSSLNYFLAVGLLTVSAVTWYHYSIHELTIGFLVSGLAVIIALVLSPILKISLHTDFAAIAAVLFWPNLWLVLIGFSIVMILAWSRIVLCRHTISEVFLGGVVGTISAIVYHALIK